MNLGNIAPSELHSDLQKLNLDISRTSVWRFITGRNKKLEPEIFNHIKDICNLGEDNFLNKFEIDSFGGTIYFKYR